MYFGISFLQSIFLNHYLTAFQFAPLHIIKVVKSHPGLQPFIRSPYLLVSPLIKTMPGHKLERISDSVGNVKPGWRDSLALQARITRTLDGFQYFVSWKSKGSLLISDLEGG